VLDVLAVLFPLFFLEVAPLRSSLAITSRSTHIDIYTVAMTTEDIVTTAHGPLAGEGHRGHEKKLIMTTTEVPTLNHCVKTRLTHRRATPIRTQPHRTPLALPPRVVAALERLQAVLKYMTVDERRTAIASLAPRVRYVLLVLMEHRPQEGATATKTASKQKKRTTARSTNAKLRASEAKGLDVRTICGAHGHRYVAQLRLGALRLYTREQPSAEVAAQHCAALAHLRNAVQAAGDIAWKDPDVFNLLLAGTLQQHNISEQDLGLGVFIYMRADQWIDRAQAITSPRLSLVDAVALCARLLRAQATSWESLRQEWAPLLRRTQRARARALTLAEAEHIADQAHQRHVKRRLVVAVQRVEKAIAHGDAVLAVESRKRVRNHGKTAAEERASKRKALIQDKQLRADKWRWLRRADLTTAELLQGPPQKNLQLALAPGPG